MTQRTLIGPFKQIIPMTGLKLKGAILDNELKIIDDGGMVLENEKILAIGNFEDLKLKFPEIAIHQLKGNHVCLPGFIDAHTHICLPQSMWLSSRKSTHGSARNSRRRPG